METERDGVQQQLQTAQLQNRNQPASPEVMNNLKTMKRLEVRFCIAPTSPEIVEVQYPDNISGPALNPKSSLDLISASFSFFSCYTNLYPITSYSVVSP